MSSLVETLTASGGVESAGFLNDIIAQLWPNINVAGCRMVKEIVEPMFAKMLPGPVASLHFTKIDLGTKPLRLSNVDVHKTDNDGIKLDMDVIWEGESDIDLDGNMLPKLGIEHIHLKGRLSVLLCPLTNIIPLIGAAQVAFINPPELKLNYTGAAEFANLGIVDKCVRKVILGIISSVAVLPNRFLVKLASDNDFFKTYLPPLGVLRLTVEKTTGLAAPENDDDGSGEKHGLAAKLAKLTTHATKYLKDVPDYYCKVYVGPLESEWRTSVQNNKRDAEWNETHDFLVADYDQMIDIELHDKDPGKDDFIGETATTVKEILLNGGTQRLPLANNGEQINGNAELTAHAKFLNLVPEFSMEDAQSQSEGQIVGVAIILIADVLGLQGDRNELNPSVKITLGSNEFNTAAKTYTPGTDIFNPLFDQAFTIPLTPDMLADPPSFRIALINKKDEAGVTEVPFTDVLEAPHLTKEENFDVGAGVCVRASISVRGLQLAE